GHCRAAALVSMAASTTATDPAEILQASVFTAKKYRFHIPRGHGPVRAAGTKSRRSPFRYRGMLVRGGVPAQPARKTVRHRGLCRTSRHRQSMNREHVLSKYAENRSS